MAGISVSGAVREEGANGPDVPKTWKRTRS